MPDPVETSLPGSPLETPPAPPAKPVKKAPAKKKAAAPKKVPAKKPASTPPAERPAESNAHGVKSVCTKKQFGAENCQCRKCAEGRLG